LAPEECEGIKDVGYKHLLLSHYRNQLLHWFVAEAMLALSLSLNGNHNAKIG
jgi:glycerol-3-phosphate O-acyltransferase